MRLADSWDRPTQIAQMAGWFKELQPQKSGNPNQDLKPKAYNLSPMTAHIDKWGRLAWADHRIVLLQARGHLSGVVGEEIVV